MPLVRLLVVLIAACGATPACAEILGAPIQRAASEAKIKASLTEIELIDESGATFDLRATLKNGKPTLVTLWAHWCPNCQAELQGFKAIGRECPTRWNVVFVSSRAQDFQKDLSKFRSAGLPWRLYRTSARMETAEKRPLLNAFSAATQRGEVITPLHYLVSKTGEVQQIVNARMDLADPRRLAAFCAD